MDFDGFLALLNPQQQQDVGGFFDRAPGFGGGGFAYGQQPDFGSNPYSRVNPGAYAGMDRREGPGDMLLADLIRAQTQDYMNNYAPIEDRLFGSITRTGTTAIDADLGRTRGAVMGASRNVQGMADRSADRFGVERSALDPNATTSTLVGGINATYQRDSDRRLELLTGGLSQVSAASRNIGR